MKRNVIITGAAGGIGRALCATFHEAGYTVLGIDREVLADTPYHWFSMDLRALHSDKNAVLETLAMIDLELKDGLHALINNAAYQVVKPMDTLTAEDWQQTLETNLLAPFWLIQYYLPRLRQVSGSVVNVSSIHTNLTKPGFSAYATSKAALTAMTRSLALELAPAIRVNAVLPGAVDTPMLREGFENHPEAFERLGAFHPVGRIALPAEVAEAVLFLAGDRVGAMTGAALPIDGGISGLLHDPDLG